MNQCIFDYQVSFNFIDNVGAVFMHLTIESEFTLIENNTETVLNPETSGTELGRILALLHQSFVSGKVKRSGEISLVFEGDVEIKVLPDPNYEAWNIWVDNVCRMVCMPGGKIAYWDLTE